MRGPRAAAGPTNGAPTWHSFQSVERRNGGETPVGEGHDGLEIQDSPAHLAPRALARSLLRAGHGRVSGKNVYGYFRWPLHCIAKKKESIDHKK